jgi:hypothetical protein
MEGMEKMCRQEGVCGVERWRRRREEEGGRGEMGKQRRDGDGDEMGWGRWDGEDGRFMSFSFFFYVLVMFW